jgi:hypothetical protein
MCLKDTAFLSESDPNYDILSRLLRKVIEICNRMTIMDDKRNYAPRALCSTPDVSMPND